MSNVFRSAVIAAPVQQVWDKIRDFNALPAWHPSIATSRIEGDGPGDQVGCVRNFNLTDGGNIREQLLGLSDCDYQCTYAILESPMPFENYVAVLRLRPITEGEQTYIEWSAEFDCAPDAAAELIATVGDGVFVTGMKALQKVFA